jgi:hypothetical protein
VINSDLQLTDMAASTKIIFPHKPLTPVTGKPNNTKLQILQRQLFANARAVQSPRGGGTNGHLPTSKVGDMRY